MLFRRMSSLAVAVLLAGSPAAFGAEPQTLTLRVDCWKTNACDGPENDHDEVTLPHRFTCEFDDPLAPGAVVQSFRVVPHLQAHASGLGGYSEMSMNGEPMMLSDSGSWGDVSYGINWGCDRPPWVYFFFGFNGNPYETAAYDDGFPGYEAGKKNRLEWFVWPEPNPWGHVGRMRLAHLTVTARYDEGNTLRFDLDETAHADARKVLIAKYREDFPYSSPAQKTDGRIEIRARVGTAGRRVYFRVIDPPDTAAYVPAADRVPNDNVGGPGHLTLTEAVSDASGSVKTELVITNRYAGDNYQVEGSFDAAFSCAPNCAKTGVLTAWKRVYLENDLMYRVGAFIGRPTTLPDRVFVTDIQPFVGQEGREFELIHADEPTQSGDRSRYRERHTIGQIVRIGRMAGEIVLTAGEVLVHDFFPNDRDVTLSDAVGLITGNAAEDYYRVSDHIVRTLFSDSLVEYVPIDATLPVVPYVESIQGRAWMENWMRFADKWGETDRAPNHQHLIAATRLQNAADLARAEATNIQERSYVYVYTEVIGASRATLLAEVAAHEVAHLWHTNPQPDPDDDEHCDERQWNSSGKVCQARHSYECLGPAGGVEICPGFLDGTGAFHYKKTAEGVDSEYRWIRERCEPVPNARVALNGQSWLSYSPLPCR